MPSPSALQEKEDVRTTNGLQQASLLDSRSRRLYRKRSECQEYGQPPSGQWHGSRSRGEAIPRPWRRQHLWSSVLIAPQLGQEKRLQSQQSVPHFRHRSKGGQRFCVSETSLSHSCLRSTAGAAIIRREQCFTTFYSHYRSSEWYPP